MTSTRERSELEKLVSAEHGGAARAESGDLKQGLIRRLKQTGAFEIRVADPRVGFENALPGQHPLELYQDCRAVVSIAVPMSPRSNNVYIGPYAPWKGPRNLGPVPANLQTDDHALDRLSRLFQWSVTLKGMIFLGERGFNVALGAVNRTQMKLCAAEAGVGVYGRAGYTLHPVLGNRMILGAILTDAPLAPDGRLAGYDPCAGCDAPCLSVCPAKAHDPEKAYPYSFDMPKCVAKRNEFVAKGFFCHSCFAACPAGTLPDHGLVRARHARSIFKRDADDVLPIE